MQLTRQTGRNREVSVRNLSPSQQKIFERYARIINEADLSLLKTIERRLDKVTKRRRIA